MPERYEAALVEAEVSAEATCIARDLINEPPTVLTPAKLAQAAQELFKETPVKVTVYGRDEVERIGLTAFLEVGKGSIYEPKLIVMEYTGAQGRGEPPGADRQGPYLRQRRILPPVV